MYIERTIAGEIQKRLTLYDLGVRNAVINNFSPLAIRQDTGALWENYIITERIKRSHNMQLMHDFHFWKTYDRQEIDLVECSPDMSIEAFEIKWGNKCPKCPVAFAGAYPDATFTVLNRDNYYCCPLKLKGSSPPYPQCRQTGIADSFFEK